MEQELEPKAEEILESLWRVNEEESRSYVTLSDLHTAAQDPFLQKLLALKFVSIEGDRVKLADAGQKEARSTVRRHRLAERLMVDVLDIKGQRLIDESACKFEHLLHRGIEEKICTLLGHPGSCPHGQPIPSGQCCIHSRESDVQLVSSLADLRAGQKGTIAYLHVGDSHKIQKMMVMGVLPGTNIALVNRNPSYVFQVGYSQFAVDANMARCIFVRIEESEEKESNGRNRKGRNRHRHTHERKKR